MKKILMSWLVIFGLLSSGLNAFEAGSFKCYFDFYGDVLKLKKSGTARFGKHIVGTWIDDDDEAIVSLYGNIYGKSYEYEVIISQTSSGYKASMISGADYASCSKIGQAERRKETIKSVSKNNRNQAYSSQGYNIEEYTIKGNGEECLIFYDLDESKISQSNCLFLSNSKGVKIVCTAKKKMCKTEKEVYDFFNKVASGTKKSETIGKEEEKSSKISMTNNGISISPPYSVKGHELKDYTIKGNGEECKLTYLTNGNVLIDKTCIDITNSKGVRIFCTPKKKVCKTETEITDLFNYQAKDIAIGDYMCVRDQIGVFDNAISITGIVTEKSSLEEKLTPNLIPKDDSHATKMGIISKINGKYELSGLNKDKSLKNDNKKITLDFKDNAIYIKTLKWCIKK